jgi:flagellar basal body rod protein FlgG
MRKIIVCLLLFLVNYLYSQDITLQEEYLLLLTDLANANTYGYKTHLSGYDFDRGIFFMRGTREINFGQGTLRSTNRHLDFAIFGNGFFKIILGDGTVGYTRNGEFFINNDTNELLTINGYRLFNSLTIPPGFVELRINDDHSITTIYPNGEEINNGYLLIYNIDINKLNYPKEPYFTSYPNFLPYFLYSGEVEEISYDRIYNKMLECSNVLSGATMVRIIEISKILGMNWENYDE